VLLLSVLGLGGTFVAADPLGTTFTYQGQLKEGGRPADGTYDLMFALYDAPTGLAPTGSSVNVDNWPIHDGLFTVQLDFGSGVFDGNARWLEVRVRPGAASGTEPYVTLSPRQPVTASPYAIYALGGPGGTGTLWSASGADIYNTNTGNVGIGTGTPHFDLHVFDTGTTNSPPTTFGLQWMQPTIPIGQNEWFYFAVGGSALTVGSGTRIIRESGTDLHFQTQELINTGLPSTQMVLKADGKVGIGTMDPISMLEIDVSENVHGVRATVPYVAVFGHRTGTTGTWPGVHGECDSESANASGVRGVINSTSPGSGSAGVYGQNKSTTLNGAGVKGVHDGYGMGVYGISTNGIGVYGTSTNGRYAAWFDGEVRADVLEIAGADVAEKFPVSEPVKPGMVVAIDPDRPGRLRMARGVYNRRVAGVVSGAGALPKGVVLGHLSGNEEAPPIALSGRVWVYCDATTHPIEPGDLLTTSDTPGHAMKVTDHTRAQGAVLGKAMTRLASGRDMVLVLVTLQ